MTDKTQFELDEEKRVADAEAARVAARAAEQARPGIMARLASSEAGK